jgi:hypothetical protein
VDSSVLLALAVKVLSPTHVVAILGVSPSLAVTKFEKSWHELVETVHAALEGGDKAAAQKRASHKGQQTGTS